MQSTEDLKEDFYSGVDINRLNDLCDQIYNSNKSFQQVFSESHFLHEDVLAKLEAFEYLSPLPIESEMSLEVKGELEIVDTFNSFYNNYKAKSIPLSEYIDTLDPKSFEHQFFVTLGELINAIDNHVFRIKNSPFADKFVARTNVRQNNWVENLILFKIGGFQRISSNNIFNVLRYLKNPRNFTIVLSIRHRKLIWKNFLRSTDEFSDEAFDTRVIELFRRLLPKASIANLKNESLIYTWFLYHEQIKSSWFDDNEVEEEEDTLSSMYSDLNWRDRRSMTPVLGVKYVAKQLAKLIENLKDESGQLIGIFGKWGRGKTFLYEEMRDHHLTEEKFIHVEFHVWKYQDAKACWGYLYEQISNAYYNEKSNRFLSKLWRTLKLNFKRYSWIPVATFLITFLIGGIVFYKWGSNENIVKWIGGITGSAVLLSFLTYFKKRSGDAKQLLNKYIKKHSYREMLGVQAEIQKELIFLLKTWLPLRQQKDSNGKLISKPDKRIILFVDDLDRCQVARIVEIIDALRVMLDNPEIIKRVIIVAAVDEKVLSHSIQLKYQSMDEPGRVREYFDKLFIAAIKLNKLETSARIEILKELTKGQVEPPKSKPVDPKEGIDQPNPVPTSAPGPSRPGTNIGPNNTKEPKIDSKYEITSEEFELLTNGMEGMFDTTPRQIRIFYFRYILARNFLAYYAIRNDWEEHWGAKEDFEYLMNIMIQLTTSTELVEADEDVIYQDDLIEEVLKDADSNTADRIRSDLREVLEMVMAY